MNAPNNFDEALQLAVAAANRYLGRYIELLGANATLAQQEYFRHLDGRTSPVRDQKCKEALGDVATARRLLNEAQEYPPLWVSSYEYDDNGSEYTFSITYNPREWHYTISRNDEGSERHCGIAQSYDEAHEIVSKIRYPDEVDPRPVPGFSIEESTAAGDVIISLRGELIAVKAAVDRVLDGASQGCGQHYEIFARKARSALEELPFSVSRDSDREALDKYLAYDRF